jgi:hypothetical protein
MEAFFPPVQDPWQIYLPSRPSAAQSILLPEGLLLCPYSLTTVCCGILSDDDRICCTGPYKSCTSAGGHESPRVALNSSPRLDAGQATPRARHGGGAHRVPKGVLSEGVRCTRVQLHKSCNPIMQQVLVHELHSSVAPSLDIVSPFEPENEDNNNNNNHYTFPVRRLGVQTRMPGRKALCPTIWHESSGTRRSQVARPSFRVGGGC